MKFQGFRLLSFFAALPFLLLLVQCGAGTAIEQQPLNTGESIILKFDGPFSYHYSVVGKPMLVEHSATNQDEIQLLNNYNDTDPQDNLEESLIAHVSISTDNKLAFILGPDPKIKSESGLGVVPDGWDEYYKKLAVITNSKHPEDGVISFDGALEFSKNLVGVTTVRKEVICADSAGHDVGSYNNTKIPNLSCPAGAHMQPTGKTLTFDYSVDQLKELLNAGSMTPKNDFIYVWHKGDPLTLTLQNIKANPIFINPAILGSSTQNKPIIINPAILGDLGNSGNSGNSGNPANPGNAGGNDNSGAADGGDQGGNVPVDTKVGGDSNAAGGQQQITTGGTSNAASGGKGCSLGGSDGRTYPQLAAVFFGLNLLALGLLRRGVKARKKI